MKDIKKLKSHYKDLYGIKNDSKSDNDGNQKKNDKKNDASLEDLTNIERVSSIIFGNIPLSERNFSVTDH